MTSSAPETRTPQERATAQAGLDDAGTPAPRTVLWALLGGPVVWSLHLLVSYVMVAYACTTAWRAGVRPALAAVSVVTVALTVWSGWTAWRWWHIAREIDRPEDDAWDARMGERTARVSFLMVVGLIIAAIFGLGIVYDTLTIWFVPLCEPGVSS